MIFEIIMPKIIWFKLSHVSSLFFRQNTLWFENVWFYKYRKRAREGCWQSWRRRRWWRRCRWTCGGLFKKSYNLCWQNTTTTIVYFQIHPFTSLINRRKNPLRCSPLSFTLRLLKWKRSRKMKISSTNSKTHNHHRIRWGTPIFDTHYLFFFFQSSCRRAKLYVYGETLLDKGTGNVTWNERGTGDVKILK